MQDLTKSSLATQRNISTSPVLQETPGTFDFVDGGGGTEEGDRRFLADIGRAIGVVHQKQVVLGSDQELPDALFPPSLGDLEKANLSPATSSLGAPVTVSQSLVEPSSLLETRVVPSRNSTCVTAALHARENMSA